MDRIYRHNDVTRRMHRPVHPRHLEVHRVRRRLAGDRDVHSRQHRDGDIRVREREVGMMLFGIWDLGL